jgi:hypothetical protein
MFEVSYGRTFALQLIPETRVLIQNNTHEQPFQDNIFCITIGLLLVLGISLGIYAFDFEKRQWFQVVKTITIVGFVATSLLFFGSQLESFKF